MSKPSHGSARFAASKKKAKARPQTRPAVKAAPDAVREEPVQREDLGNGRAQEPVLQFRPKAAREAAPVRVAAGRASAARVAFPFTDYRYVYTDLKMIAVIAGSLLALLIVLSFVIR